MNNTNLLEKWKLVVDYTSDVIPPIPEDKREHVAIKLEEFETLIQSYKDSGKCNDKFAKILIPQVRVTLGGLIIGGDIEIDNKPCLLLLNGVTIKTDWCDVPDYIGEMAIPYFKERDITTVHGLNNPYCGIYIKDENNNWREL